MITTPRPILELTSTLLKENNPDLSFNRVVLFRTAVNKLLSEHKMKFARKSYNINVPPNTQSLTFDLLTIADFDPHFGVDAITPDGMRYELTNNTMLKVTGVNTNLPTVITVFYYAIIPTTFTSAEQVLPFSIPDKAALAIALLIKSYVHDSKRQRLDARNALLDYKEEIGNLRLQMENWAEKPKTFVNKAAAYIASRTYSD